MRQNSHLNLPTTGVPRGRRVFKSTQGVLHGLTLLSRVHDTAAVDQYSDHENKYTYHRDIPRFQRISDLWVADNNKILR